MRGRSGSIALTLVGVGCMAALLSGQATPPPQPGQVSFAKDVEPILERSCRSCHGETMQMGGLDLRTRDGALRGGAHGTAITPSNADGSRLYRMVAGLEQPAMPMSGNLTPQDVATLKAWIDQGARWDVPVSFARDIRPIFEASCGSCHGEAAQLSDSTSARATALSAAAFAGRTSSPATPTRAACTAASPGSRSRRCRRRATPLSAAQVAAVKQWIDEGAKWDASAPSATASASAAAALAALETRVITPEERNYWAFKLPVQAPLPGT